MNNHIVFLTAVRPSYRKFQATLKDIVLKLLVKEEGQEVLVEDVLKTVQRYLPDASSTSTTDQLTRQISLILRTKVERVGKARKS